MGTKQSNTIQPPGPSPVPAANSTPSTRGPRLPTYPPRLSPLALVHAYPGRSLERGLSFPPPTSTYERGPEAYKHVTARRFSLSEEVSQWLQLFICVDLMSYDSFKSNNDGMAVLLPASPVTHQKSYYKSAPIQEKWNEGLQYGLVDSYLQVQRGRRRLCDYMWTARGKGLVVGFHLIEIWMVENEFGHLKGIDPAPKR